MKNIIREHKREIICLNGKISKLKKDKLDLKEKLKKNKKKKILKKKITKK